MTEKQAAKLAAIMMTVNAIKTARDARTF